MDLVASATWCDVAMSKQIVTACSFGQYQAWADLVSLAATSSPITRLGVVKLLVLGGVS